MMDQDGYLTLETDLPLGVTPSEESRRLANREDELTTAITAHHFLVTNDYGTTIIAPLPFRCHCFPAGYAV